MLFDAVWNPFRALTFHKFGKDKVIIKVYYDYRIPATDYEHLATKAINTIHDNILVQWI